MKPFDDETRLKLDSLLDLEPPGWMDTERQIPVGIPEWFTEQGFRRWILAHRKWEILGSIGSPMNCPIARFMRDGDADFPVVTPSLISFVDGGRRYCFQPPLWTSQFIEFVDCTGEAATAKRCLGYLRELGL